MALKTKKSADADIATTVRDILNAGKEDSKKVAEEGKDGYYKGSCRD